MTLVLTPYDSLGQSPAYLVNGVLPDGSLAFAKAASEDTIRRELRAMRVARELGIKHLLLDIWPWRHPHTRQTFLLSRYHADAQPLARHPLGAARLRALDEGERVRLLRWQHLTGDVDRHAENYLVLSGGQIVAIDHGAAYRHPTVALPGVSGLARGPHENAVWHRGWSAGERAARRAYERAYRREREWGR